MTYNKIQSAVSSDKLIEFLKHTVGNLSEAYLLTLAELAALKEKHAKEQLAELRNNEAQLIKELQQAEKTITVYKSEVHLLAELQRNERLLKSELQQAKKTIQEYKNKAEKESSSLSQSASNQSNSTTKSSSQQNEFDMFGGLLRRHLERLNRRQ